MQSRLCHLAPLLSETSGRRIPLRNSEPSAMRCFCEGVDNQLIVEISRCLRVPFFLPLFNGICYRLFAFWDTEAGALVVATHGIVKKTRKTPGKEIEKAERIRQEYFNDKK